MRIKALDGLGQNVLMLGIKKKESVMRYYVKLKEGDWIEVSQTLFIIWSGKKERRWECGQAH